MTSPNRLMLTEIATILSCAVGLGLVGLGVYSAYFNHKNKQIEIKEKEQERKEKETYIGQSVAGCFD